jgi:uncharacterized repeat protein (TIGR03803 family)
MKNFLIQRAALRLTGLGTLAMAFAITPASHAAVTFQTLSSSSTPCSSLVLAPDGNFYGTTFYGGDNDLGTVFQVTPSGASQILHSFAGTADGANPSAGLMVGADGNLYGTTQYGGASNVGAIFKITTSGSFTLLHSLAGGAEGEEPVAGLVAGTNGVLYGTASRAGSLGFGTVFQVTTGGTFSALHQFTGTDGDNPGATLTAGMDGALYGTTQYGGANNRGAIFKITTTGTFTSLFSFNGLNGAIPKASLVQGSDGTFYGTTAYGGQSEFGTVFKMSPTGSFSSLYSMANESLGSNPSSGLALGVDGKLYGNAVNGGLNGFGAVLQLTTAGSVSSVHDFTGEDDGGNPSTTIAKGTGGNLYGTTQLGGAGESGTIYQISIPSAPVITTQPASVASFIGTTALFNVSVDAQPPLTYTWQKNGVNLANGGNISGANSTTLSLHLVTAADEGIYSVTVANAFGSIVSSNALLTVVIMHPHFNSVQLSSDHKQIQYSGTVGAPNGQYTVLSSTDVAAPLGTWLPVTTNQFDSTGGFTFTHSVNTNEPQRFYLLRLP